MDPYRILKKVIFFGIIKDFLVSKEVHQEREIVWMMRRFSFAIKKSWFVDFFDQISNDKLFIYVIYVNSKSM